MFGQCFVFDDFCKFEPNVVVFVCFVDIYDRKWWMKVVFVCLVLFGCCFCCFVWFLWKNFEMCCFCLFLISDNVPTSSDKSFWGYVMYYDEIIVLVMCSSYPCLCKGFKNEMMFLKKFWCDFCQGFGKMIDEKSTELMKKSFENVKMMKKMSDSLKKSS